MTKEEKRLLKRIVFGLHQENLTIAGLLTPIGDRKTVEDYFSTVWEYMNVDELDTEDRAIPVGETGKEDV